MSNVKRALLQVRDVIYSKVHLNPQGARITINKFIAVDELLKHRKNMILCNNLVYWMEVFC